MKIAEIIAKTTKKLSVPAFVDQPDLEAEVLAMFVLNKEKEYIFSNLDHEITKNQVKLLDKLVDRRLKGEPIAYLLGRKEFYGLDFLVNKDVLIPRPETELIVDLVLTQIGKIGSLLAISKASVFGRRGPTSDFKNIKIIDVGTGSGCIPIAIAKNTLKDTNLLISASDISEKALNVAKMNARNHQAKINFIKSDLLRDVKDRFNIITANLPYIRSSEASSIAKLIHHPKLSLDGGKDGLELIKKLIRQSRDKLATKGVILLEIAPEQKKEIYRFTKEIFKDPKINTYQDLAGIDRVVEITI